MAIDENKIVNFPEGTQDVPFDEVNYVMAAGPDGKFKRISKNALKNGLTIEGQRIASVAPGALPAGPAGQTRYMEVTAVGTWTYGGTPVGSNTKGNITTFWWDGSTWSLNDMVALPQLETASDLDTDDDNKALAASQGKILNEKIDNVVEALDPIISKLSVPTALTGSIIEDVYVGGSGTLIEVDVMSIQVFDVSEYIGKTVNVKTVGNTSTLARLYGIYSSEEFNSTTAIFVYPDRVDSSPSDFSVQIPDGASRLVVSRYSRSETLFATISAEVELMSSTPIMEEVKGITDPLDEKIDLKTDSLETQINATKNKLSEVEVLIQEDIITEKHLTSNGNLSDLSVYSMYVYDISEYVGRSVSIKITGNLGSARAYGFYNSDTFNQSSALYVRPGTFTNIDESYIVPEGSAYLLVTKYVNATVPLVTSYSFDDVPILDKVKDMIEDSKPVSVVLNNGLSAVKIYNLGEVKIFSRLDKTRAISTHFRPCMFNQLYTYYRTSYVNYSDINKDDLTTISEDAVVTTGSDNIGPIRVQGGDWTGGNHSYDNDGATRTAETLMHRIFADGQEVDTSIDKILFCKVLEIIVHNKIYDPRVPPTEGSNILSIPLADEFVKYRIEEGDVSVTLSHRYTSQAIADVYYGMQTVCKLDEFLTSGGDTVTFKSRALAVNFTKGAFPNFNRFLQRNTAKNKYESMMLNTSYRAGTHSYLSDIRNIAITSPSKLYHSILYNNTIESGDVISWNGTYSWKNPVSENAQYICFVYIINGIKTIAINIFSEFTGFVEVPREVMSSIELDISSPGITLQSDFVEPMGVKISANGAGFIYIKIK